MNVTAGGSYKIIGRGGEWSYFHVQEMYEYHGHYGVFGISTKHQIYVPTNRGYIDIPSRPVAFPMIETSDQRLLAQFCEELFMGEEIYLESITLLTINLTPHQIRIPNTQPLKGWYEYGESTATINPEQLKAVPVKLIDLWERFVLNDGKMPEAYIRACTDQRAGANT